MTHYSTLGVSENAGLDEIKQAYRKLANQHHPDKGGNTADFQKIQEAYDILGNEQSRAQYDAERQGRGFRFTVNGQPFEHAFGGMEDIFSQFGFNPFGDPFGHTRQPRRNKDLRIRIQISLADTLQEQQKTVSVTTSTGDRFTVQVTVPRGVTTGTQIKYSGLGDNLFNTLQRGDLYVQFEVLADSNFSVDGIDLISALNVNCIEAMVGCEKTVVGVDGSKFSLRVPPGTQFGSRLRIRNQGLWALNQNIRGNLLISVNIVTPQLNSEQLQLAEKLLESINTTNI